MLKANEILRVKGDVLYTISPDASVQEAIDIMGEQDIGSLVVLEHGELVGMLTFREVMRFLQQKRDIASATVRGIMDDHPVSVTPNTDVAEVQRLMLNLHIRYMPIMDGPTLLGVISLYDMTKALIELEKFENNMLKAYIKNWSENDDKSED
ncbi:CBS domain-containing protein [Pelistega europaea]|uniref:CBS domain-containing protein n=1 Tax=Pelistega europaea TaxID=106147 RepID=A0A7Y4L8F5_9BURK|nr:CBS domain-containing protein [Pelistega europaea]NOL48895.1 CBS domain-containing protein [Pelistega europaea]